MKTVGKYFGGCVSEICIRQAEDKTGILRTTIGQCCNGKVKTAGGYHWEYADMGSDRS